MFIAGSYQTVLVIHSVKQILIMSCECIRDFTQNTEVISNSISFSISVFINLQTHWVFVKVIVKTLVRKAWRALALPHNRLLHLNFFINSFKLKINVLYSHIIKGSVNYDLIKHYQFQWTCLEKLFRFCNLRVKSETFCSDRNS